MLYKNKYRSKSLRLENWDYSNAGWYYVTICTNEKKKYFGEVVNGKIILNNIGNIVKKFLTEIPQHFSNVFIDLFVVMPNHIHLNPDHYHPL
jgi:REP element-mobilizing transposase RayT